MAATVAEMTPGSLDFDEHGHAGPEHLDAEYVARYDRKAATDPSDDVEALRGAGVKAASAAINIIDQFARIPVMKQAKTMMNGALGQFTGKNGGIQTSGLTDKARNPLSVDPATKQTAEDAFKAKVKDSTNFLVKTTIEAGLDPYFTAGNRVNVTLLAALTNPYNLVQGVLLIADCMHETYFDNRKVSGTTTIRGVALNPLALINGQ